MTSDQHRLVTSHSINTHTHTRSDSHILLIHKIVILTPFASQSLNTFIQPSYTYM